MAYLALTAKIETPIRDRLAFALHSELSPRGFTAAREWRRVDIAVLRGATLVELKARVISATLFDESNAAMANPIF